MADKVMTIESWTDGGDNIVRLLGLGARSYISYLLDMVWHK